MSIPDDIEIIKRMDSNDTFPHTILFLRQAASGLKVALASANVNSVRPPEIINYWLRFTRIAQKIRHRYRCDNLDFCYMCEKKEPFYYYDNTKPICVTRPRSCSLG